MANLADRAQDLDDLLRQKQFDQKIDPKEQMSRDICDCGRIIPVARRKILPGVQNCVHCQAENERRSF